MDRFIRFLATILVLGVAVAGIALFGDRKDSVPLHDIDVFISSDQVQYSIDTRSTNLHELLRSFDFTYYQKINNPTLSKMFYIVSVTKDEVNMTRYERDFDEVLYTFHVAPADEYFFITDMDADIRAEIVYHNGFISIVDSILLARNFRTYDEIDDGVVMNPPKILINFELQKRHAEFTVGLYPNTDSNQYTVNIVEGDR